MVNANYFSSNSLVNLCLDASICRMNTSTKRSGFLTFCLDVGGCACLNLSGGLRARLCPSVDHYLPSCEGALGFLLSSSKIVA